MVLDGSVNIRDLETQYRLSLPSDQGFETLGGFMLARFQRIPKQGDAFEFDGRRFSVLEMEGRRIARVLVETLEHHSAEQAGD
jgi:CBS domain containing-hemolysin-like protein